MPAPVRGQNHNISLEHENGSLVTLLVQTTKEFSASVADVVSRQGHTLDEWMVLHAVANENGSSVSQISVASGCHGATLTRVVDKLVANGLVYREASQVDRRKVVVFIADHGRRVHSAIDSQLRQLQDSVAEVLEQAGLSAVQFTELLTALQKLPAPSRE